MQAKILDNDHHPEKHLYNILINKEAGPWHFLYPQPLPSNKKLSPRKTETGTGVSHLRKHLRKKEGTSVLPG